MRSRTCRAFIALVWVIGISSPSFASQQQNSDPIPDISAMSFAADVNEGSVSLNFELVLSDNFSSSESLSLLFWFVGKANVDQHTQIGARGVVYAAAFFTSYGSERDLRDSCRTVV